MSTAGEQGLGPSSSQEPSQKATFCRGTQVLKQPQARAACVRHVLGGHRPLEKLLHFPVKCQLTHNQSGQGAAGPADALCLPRREGQDLWSHLGGVPICLQHNPSVRASRAPQACGAKPGSFLPSPVLRRESSARTQLDAGPIREGEVPQPRPLGCQMLVTQAAACILTP